MEDAFKIACEKLDATVKDHKNGANVKGDFSSWLKKLEYVVTHLNTSLTSAKIAIMKDENKYSPSYLMELITKQNDKMAKNTNAYNDYASIYANIEAEYISHKNKENDKKVKLEEDIKELTGVCTKCGAHIDGKSHRNFCGNCGNEVKWKVYKKQNN